MSIVVSRFAPSPTGVLHLGHAYSAVQAWRLTRGVGDVGDATQGRLLLRIDDLDSTRSRESYIEAMCADLAWLGIDFDGAPIRQSTRGAEYQQALDDLRSLGLLYPCFCSRADIAAMAAAPHGTSAAIYPGTCRNLSQRVRADRMQREEHCWRLDMAQALAYVQEHCKTQGETQGTAHATKLRWYDERLGERVANPSAHGDIVVARKDALASYHLASTLDDAAMEISLVVRGADLLESTDIHILLQRLLGLPQPRYCHHALVGDGHGKRLAKRDSAAELRQLRNEYQGTDLAAMLAMDKLPTGYVFVNS